MLNFGAGNLSLEDMTQRINRGTDSYLEVFLKRAGMKSEKIPKGTKPRMDHCIKWATEPNAERCPYILLTNGELKDIYRQKKGRAPKSAWNTEDLITHILLMTTQFTNKRLLEFDITVASRSSSKAN